MGGKNSGRHKGYTNINFVEKYNSIKSLMELGYPFYIACKKEKTSTTTLMRIMNEEQKRALYEIKYSLSSPTLANTNPIIDEEN